MRSRLLGPCSLGGQPVGGQIGSQALLQLGQGGVAQVLTGAATPGGQAATEGGEVGCVHRAVYIPPY
jgi:hypothetical protein